MLKPFFVYLLRCSDGSYYAGHTDDLERRVAEHQSGALAGYTHERRPIALVWSQETATRAEALASELQIKGWGRAKMEALMAGDWALVSQLARSKKGLRQAQPERETERVPIVLAPLSTSHPECVKQPAHPEPVEESAHPEPVKESAHPEPVEGSDQPELVEGPEPVEGSDPPELVEGPEPVEGLVPNTLDLALIDAVVRGERRAIAKSITLLESTRADHRIRADALLNALLPHTGKAMRLGVSGVPGVGKSTFIEVLGLALIAQGHRVAVLAIDPSSSLSGGSILGDKTRMEQLSVNPAAYIRPSPASGTLGGVAERTREAMLVCEAAGYDVVIVETVGVGQSEIAVASMTDMFVLMQLPNAGDDLQAIKKGVMELADLVVINKADIDPLAASRAEAFIRGSLRMSGAHGDDERWVTRVMQLSALKAQGVDVFWAHVEEFHRKRHASGEFNARRQQQALAWMWDIVHARLHADFHHHDAVRNALPQTVRDVTEARIAPSAAARALLNLFEPATR